MWDKLLLFFALVGYSAALMCYQCSDTSDDDGGNHCQTWVRTLRKYRNNFVATGDMPHINVKNCTGYGNYCQIATVESGNLGGMLSYIRDCSDGERFFGDNRYDALFTDIVLPNNQTACAYDPSGFLTCVTLCKDEDFCNGPDSVEMTRGSALVTLLMLCVSFLIVNLLH